MSKLDELNAIVEQFNIEAEKFFEKGNKAAGTRARKCLQDLKVKCQEIRIDIQQQKNA